MHAAARILPLCAHVQRHLDEDVSLAALAARAGRSPFELHRTFRRVTGETTKQYTLRLRLDRAAAELLDGRRTILDVALGAGFAGPEVFARAFRRRFGVAPRTYRARGGAGDRARHRAIVAAVGPCIGLYHLDRRERTPMTTTVTTRDLTPQPALVVRRRVAAADLATVLGEILPKVWTHAQGAGIPFAGPPFTRYVEMGRGLMTIEAGLPIAGPGTPEGEIELVELPGGPAAVAVHEGGYESLADTHAAVERWIEAQGRAAGAAPWEVYVTDPADKPDPKDWRTEVIWPLR